MFQVYYNYDFCVGLKCVFWAISMPSAWYTGYPGRIKLMWLVYLFREKEFHFTALCYYYRSWSWSFLFFPGTLSVIHIGHLGPQPLATTGIHLISSSRLSMKCYSLLIGLYSSTIYNVFGRIRLRFFLEGLCMRASMLSPSVMSDSWQPYGL